MATAFSTPIVDVHQSIVYKQQRTPASQSGRSPCVMVRKSEQQRHSKTLFMNASHKWMDQSDLASKEVQQKTYMQICLEKNRHCIADEVYIN